jgi:hypothetical protein
MLSEVFVPFSLRAKFLISIFADLIESDARFTGISRKGIDALTPDAFGSSPSIRDSIREIMSVCAVNTPPPKRAKAEAVAISAKCFLFI